jgi:hypothetical protein
MRAILFVLLAGVLFGCGRATQPTGPVESMEAYTKELKARVPLDPDEFKRKGLTAESYVKDDAYPLFREVTLRVEPVCLRDDLTGKTATYTRARLIRNDPRPGDKRHAPEPFEWARVEMFP